MAAYRMAVLKCTWSDTPFNGSVPQGLLYDDWVLNRMFLPLSPWWGIATYWEHCSYGTIDLTGSEIFPWRALKGFPTPTTTGTYLRGAVAQQAVSQAKAEGWPLDAFDGIVVWVAPSAAMPQDAGSSPTSIGGKAFCTLYEGSRHDFYAHEFGHALRFVHPWGPSGSAATPDLPYRDPYCVMSAMGYAGAQPVYSIPADPDGPPAGQPFWGSLPPMPSAAAMLATVADFASSRHVLRAGTISPGWQRTVTLRARDIVNGRDPALAVAEVAPGGGGPREAYTVELRRPQGWDRGIERITAVGASPPAGLVVHSLRNLDEFLGQSYDLERSPTAYYEGAIPLPLQSTDNDWLSGGGDFVVRVGEVADDLSWAELTLGGADLDRDGAVTVEVVEGGWSELHAEGRAEGVRIFVCGTGDFRYWIDHQHTRLTCTANPMGYEQPSLAWRVNGVPLPAGGSGTVSVPAVVTIPEPASSSKAARTVDLAWQRSGTTLLLDADPEDGNHTLDIEVTAIETGASASTSPSAAYASGDVTGIIVTYEQSYYDAFAECVGRVRGFNDRFSESRVFPRLNPGDPITKVSTVIDLLREDIAGDRPFLRDQLEHASEVFGSRVRAHRTRRLRVDADDPSPGP
jgi:hypothetical protein